jgi:hypothetical protein
LAGSPKKRARRLERERLRREALQKEESAKTQPAVTRDAQAVATVLPAPYMQPAQAVTVAPPLRGEILPPDPSEQLEITRTALKRAMRKRAAEYAERAIDVLSKNLDSEDAEIAQKAANDLLKWGFGNPQNEIEAGKSGALSIAILRFADTEEAN